MTSPVSSASRTLKPITAVAFTAQELHRFVCVEAGSFNQYLGGMLPHNRPAAAQRRLSLKLQTALAKQLRTRPVVSINETTLVEIAFELFGSDRKLDGDMKTHAVNLLRTVFRQLEDELEDGRVSGFLVMSASNESLGQLEKRDTGLTLRAA